MGWQIMVALDEHPGLFAERRKVKRSFGRVGIRRGVTGPPKEPPRGLRYFGEEQPENPFDGSS